LDSLRPMRDLLLFVGLAAFLSAVTLAGGASGLPEFGRALYPIPVALYVARRRPFQALALVLCAACAAVVIVKPGVITVDLQRPFGLEGAYDVTYMVYAVTFGLLAASGLPMGLGLRRRWSFGKTLFATSSCVALATAIEIFARWELWIAMGRAGLETPVRWLADDSGLGTGEAEVAASRVVDALSRHWESLSVGFALASAIMFTCALVSLTSWALRRFWNEDCMRAGFRMMRPPDWLVWPVIAVALVILIERQWPNRTIEAVSWNVAVVLAVVYWLNGLSVFAYAFFALQSPVLIALALLAIAIYLVMSQFPVVCLVGVLDTWVGFRTRLDRWNRWLAEQEKIRRESGDDPF
jgi:hypothetical protein